MDREELIRDLKSLAQLDVDAVRVYEEALEHVRDDDVRKAFEQFQGEHRYHSQRLGEAIRGLGEEMPEMRVDLVGHLADWVTAVRSFGGTEGALHAMDTAEKYHNRRYAEAVEWDVGDPELAALLRRFRDDEKRHLDYVESRVGERAGMRE